MFNARLTVGSSRIAEHLTYNTLLLFPNPTTGNLTIEQFGNSTIKEVRIYDILGEFVYQSEIDNPKSEINISQFSKGIYFAEIKTAQGVVRKKVAVQ